MRILLLLAAVALAACRNANQPGVTRAQAVKEGLPQEAKTALADLKDLGAAQVAEFQIRGKYAGVDELKNLGLLAAQWPRSGYSISCEAARERFACTADPKSGEHHLFVDATLQVRHSRGGPASAASEALEYALAN